jgi:hypothetical protein
MATSRPFSYTTGPHPTGTHKVGNILIGLPLDGFNTHNDGLEGWNGPDEELGYIIPIPVPSDIQPTPVKYRTYLDPSHKGSNITLAGSNQTANQANGSQQSVLGVDSINQGDRVMFSVLVELTAAHPTQTDHVIGIGKQTMNYEGSPLGGWPGNDNDSIGYCSNGLIYQNGNQVGTGATWTDGDIIDILINTQTNGMSVRVNGGYWNNDPGQDPVANPSAMGTEIFKGPFYPALCPEEGGSMTIQNSATYPVPGGYKFFGDVTASVGFIRSQARTDASFVSLVNNKFGQSFSLDLSGAIDASRWLNINGYWTSYGISFTINSSDITSGYGYGGNANELGVNGVDGFENINPQNNLEFGYVGSFNSSVLRDSISAALVAVGIDPTNSTGYIWNVTWGAGSSIPSGLVKFGYVQGLYGNDNFYIESIDPSDAAWVIPGYQNGTSLVGTFLFSATFTPYISLINKGGWC